MNLESYGGPNPLLNANAFPYIDVPIAGQQNELRGHVDYLMTTFHEYKTLTDKAIQELQQRTVSLEEELQQMKDQMESKITKKRSCRIKVPDEVQSDVKLLYSGAPYQFDATRKFLSKENDPARKYLEHHLQKKYDGKYSSKQIHAGVHRYYESRRRGHNDKQPERAEQVAKVKANEIKRKLRRKLYNDRAGAVKNAEERQMWEQIDYNYMTDMSEEEVEGEVVINCYALSWRSQKLRKFIKKLDKSRVVPKTGKTRVAKATPSKLPPPPNAPTWTTKKQDNASAVHMSTSDDARTSQWTTSQNTDTPFNRQHSSSSTIQQSGSTSSQNSNRPKRARLCQEPSPSLFNEVPLEFNEEPLLFNEEPSLFNVEPSLPTPLGSDIWTTHQTPAAAVVPVIRNNY